MIWIYSILAYIIIYFIIGLINVILVEWSVFQEKTINFYEYRIKSWIILILFWPFFYIMLGYFICKSLFSNEEDED